MLPFIKIFNLDIPTYGLMMATGLVLGGLLFYCISRSKGIPGLDSFILTSYSLIAALAGAKLLALLTSIDQLIFLWQSGYKEAFWYFLLNGGMVFYGGVIAGFITFVLVAQYHKIELLLAMDCAAPAIALGHFFGRLGCFGVGCCYGAPHEQVGLRFHHSPVAPNAIALLPVQLFEAAFNISLCLVLLLLFRRSKEGMAASLYLLAYGAWRFVIEFWRGDSYRGFLLGLSTSQWISILLLISGLFVQLYALRRAKLLSRKTLDR